jgi:hypothetical protein
MLIIANFTLIILLQILLKCHLKPSKLWYEHVNGKLMKCRKSKQVESYTSC